MKGRGRGGTRSSTVTESSRKAAGRAENDSGEPERPRDGTSVQRRTETDKFVVYVARSFVVSNTQTGPVLPWIANRLSAPEYDVGVQVRTTRPMSEVVTPIAEFEPAMELLRSPGGCRALRLVTFRGRMWVWSKVASVAEQHRFLGLPPPSQIDASRDVVTRQWRDRRGTDVPVVSALSAGVLSSDYVNEVTSIPLEGVYVDRSRFMTKASNVLIWGLFRDGSPSMSIVSMCKSNTRDATLTMAYKEMIQGFELMLTYSPDTDMERRMAASSGTSRTRGYAPSRHAMSVMLHSVPVWGAGLVERFKVAFFDLMEADRRMKIPVRYITDHYLPCLRETMCDPDERWVAGRSRARERGWRGTCNHIRFEGDTTMRVPASVWERPYTHRLEADLT